MEDIYPEIEQLFLAADAGPQLTREQYEQRLAQLPDLCDSIGELLGEACALDTNIQNAGFFARISMSKSQKGSTQVRLSYVFSLSAEMVAVYVDPTWTDPPPTDTLDAIADLLRASNFVPIPWEQAMHPYTGEWTGFDGKPLRDSGEHDWIWRFFDYQ